MNYGYEELGEQQAKGCRGMLFWTYSQTGVGCTEEVTVVNPGEYLPAKTG